MIKKGQSILADALRLEVQERAELASKLLASLDGPGDADAEAAWDEELRRRIQAIDAGTVELEPWDDVTRRIERDVLGR